MSNGQYFSHRILQHFCYLETITTTNSALETIATASNCTHNTRISVSQIHAADLVFGELAVSNQLPVTTLDSDVFLADEIGQKVCTREPSSLTWNCSKLKLSHIHSKNSYYIQFYMWLYVPTLCFSSRICNMVYIDVIRILKLSN